LGIVYKEQYIPEQADGWACAKCKAVLVPKKKIFSYMGTTVSHEVLRCPVCGIVFISKQLADGKMAEIELLLEDK